MQPAAKLRDVVDQELKHVSFAFVRASCFTTRPCILQALVATRVPTAMKELFFRGVGPGLCLKPKRAFASWNMVRHVL